MTMTMHLSDTIENSTTISPQTKSNNPIEDEFDSDTCNNKKVGKKSKGKGDSTSSNNNNSMTVDQLQANKELITTMSGPTIGREFSKQVKLLYMEDKRPIIKFYKLLNLKPYKQTSKLDVTKLLQLMQDYPELCVEVYRFEAFVQYLLHPIHMLCALNVSVDVIKVCIKNCQAALFHDYSPIGAPIHYACMFNCNFATIRYLIKKDVDALELPNTDHGMTPLHLAIQYEADYETVAFLTDRCPAACRMLDHDGMTPLHHAMIVAEPSLQIIEDLTEVDPTACEMVCNKGFTPLLLGIYRYSGSGTTNIDDAIYQDLIVSNPKSVSIRIQRTDDTSIVTTLRLAIEKKMNVRILKDLLRADPTLIEVLDENGNLPIHTAVQVKHTDIEIYQLLASKYPDGLEVPNAAKYTPHRLAKKRFTSNSIVQYPHIVEYLNPYEEVNDEA